MFDFILGQVKNLKVKRKIAMGTWVPQAAIFIFNLVFVFLYVQK